MWRRLLITGRREPMYSLVRFAPDTFVVIVNGKADKRVVATFQLGYSGAGEFEPTVYCSGMRTIHGQSRQKADPSHSLTPWYIVGELRAYIMPYRVECVKDNRRVLLFCCIFSMR
jgi:hypothetical protein